MTTSQLGRTKLVTWPDLNDPAGASQVNTIQAAVAEMSNNAPARIQETTAGDASTIEVDHNMGVGLDQLTVLIYSGTHPALTRIQNPFGIAVPWGVNEKVGSEKLVLEVDTPASGTPASFTVIVIHDVKKDSLITQEQLAVSSDITLQNKVLHRVDTSAARTLTLPAVAANLYIELKDVTGSAATNNVTIATPGAETVDGGATFLMDSDYMSVAIISDGTNYFVI